MVTAGTDAVPVVVEGRVDVIALADLDTTRYRVAELGG